MKKRILIWELWGFAVTSLGGTLLHYLYEWLGKPIFIAPFSGVNESTFEHMKLLYWPMLLFGLIQYFFFRERRDFFCIKLRAMLLGLSLIPLLFYTYNGVIGTSPSFVNIVIFFVAAAAAYIFEARKFILGDIICPHPRTSFTILILIGFVFFLFTFFTPALAIFKDPIDGSFGI